MHCAQATTPGLKYVCEQRDVPDLAPFRLRIRDSDQETCQSGQVPASQRESQVPGGLRAHSAHCAQPPPPPPAVGVLSGIQPITKMQVEPAAFVLWPSPFPDPGHWFGSTASARAAPAWPVQNQTRHRRAHIQCQMRGQYPRLQYGCCCCWCYCWWSRCWDLLFLLRQHEYPTWRRY